MTAASGPPERQVTRIAAYALCVSEVRSCCVESRRATGPASDNGLCPAVASSSRSRRGPGRFGELEEETGLRGTIVELLEVIDWSGRWVHPTDEVDEAFHAIQVVYRVQVTGGELRDALTDQPMPPAGSRWPRRVPCPWLISRGWESASHSGANRLKAGDDHFPERAAGVEVLLGGRVSDSGKVRSMTGATDRLR